MIDKKHLRFLTKTGEFLPEIFLKFHVYFYDNSTFPDDPTNDENAVNQTLGNIFTG